MRRAEPGEAGVVGLGETLLRRAPGGGRSAGPGKQRVYQLGWGAGWGGVYFWWVVIFLVFY